MVPELGHFALLLALSLALVQAAVPLLGSFTGNRAWMALSGPLAWGQLVFVAIAFGGLLIAFVTDDFSVRYVAANSNTLMPTLYKVSAVWGAHEGSLLLWALMLAGWGAAVATRARQLPLAMRARVLAVLALVAIGFLLFMILTSNPFARIFPAPLEGRDLNPLLQDFALAIHPPLLYMGYVGFSIAFAFAIAALLGGRLDPAWAHWSRPWTLGAWVFLTLGIALGSWWAYYELGWGGWWFWDPVENASFMPWLVGTALIHSLAVSEKRAAFKTWTLLLAIAAFSLSLLGTFLVRSGVLTSVHAFATDPARGAFILIFLCAVIGGSLALYAWRAPGIGGGGRFDLLSRETLLLANNLLLTALAMLVLFGTLAPLIYDAAGWGKISVGFPWFNKMFIALAPLLILALGLGPLTRWKHDSPWHLLGALWLGLALALGGLALAVWPELPQPPRLPGWAELTALSSTALSIGLGLALAGWLVGTHLVALADRFWRRGWFAGLAADLRGRGRSYYGMWLAHLGLAVFIVGVTLVSNRGTETDLRMAPGDVHEVAGYRFQFNGATPLSGPNYTAQRGEFVVYDGERTISVLHPEKRMYFSGGMPMTEAAIDAGLLRDLYVSLGEPLGTDGAWAARIYHKPFVRWIWLGTLLMALGGLLAMGDRRYRIPLVPAAPPMPAAPPAISLEKAPAVALARLDPEQV